MALELTNWCIASGLKCLKHAKLAHCRLLRLNLHHDNDLLSIILRSTINFSNNAQYPILVFHKTPTNSNTFLYNTMIRGMVSKDRFNNAVHLYASMHKAAIVPDSFTFSFVLKACARLNLFHLGVMIHSLVFKTGFDCDVFVKTNVVCFYSKCGFLRDAWKVFDDMVVKNVVSWTGMICGCIEFGKFREAVDLFRGLLESGLRPDGFVIVRVLRACARLGDLESGRWIDRCMRECGLSRNVFVATSLVDMYTKCGSMEEARFVFDGMVEKDIVCWSAMIQGYASNGLPREAIELFFEMRKVNVRPDCYAMVGALSSCASLGALELGNWAKGLMNYEEFLSNPVLGTSLIDFYAKCGSMEEALGVYKMMKEKDRMVFNAVISGLAMYGQVGAAFGVFGQMGKFGIPPNEHTFVGLLCGCTHAGLVDDGRCYFKHES